jgi:hypothetical protein
MGWLSNWGRTHYGELGDVDMTPDNVWKNKDGAMPPDWIQGRGAGLPGRVLHICTKQGVLRIPPDALVYRGEDGEPYLP